MSVQFSSQVNSSKLVGSSNNRLKIFIFPCLLKIQSLRTVRNKNYSREKDLETFRGFSLL